MTSKIQLNTDLSSLANQAEYGLEYYLRGEFGDKTTRYIEKGIKLCRLLRDGSKASLLSRIKLDQLGPLTVYKGLKNGDNAQKIMRETEKAMKLLQKIKKREKVSQQKVRKLQELFKNIGKPYRNSACSTLALLSFGKEF